MKACVKSGNHIAKNSVQKKFLFLGLAVLLASVLYLCVDVNLRYFEYAMSLRKPKLIVMLITAFCIGGASIVFQSIINNTIVIPLPFGNELVLHSDTYGGGIFSWFRELGGQKQQRGFYAGYGVDALLATLVASFSNVNSEIILLSLILMAAVLLVLRKDLALLNVIAVLPRLPKRPSLWKSRP